MLYLNEEKMVRIMLEDMNRIIEFVLERYSVKVYWRLIPLTFDNWKKLSTEKIKSFSNHNNQYILLVN